MGTRFCYRCGHTQAAGTVCEACHAPLPVAVPGTESRTGDAATVAPPSRIPTVLLTLFFGLFGLIPASLAVKSARQAQQPEKPIWRAFGVSFAVSLVVPVTVLALGIAMVTGALPVPSSLDGLVPAQPQAVTPMPAATQNSATSAPAQTPAATPATSESTPSATTTPSATPSTTPSAAPSTTSEADAAQALDRLLGEWSVRTDSHYLIQLSSKWVGVTDSTQIAPNGTHTFRAADILIEHQELAKRFGPSVHLVRWDSFGKQVSLPNGGQTIYVTVYDPENLTADSAAQWCTRNFPNLSGTALKNVCYPRQATPPA